MLISLLLVVLVVAVYLPSLRNGFVHYDDDVYLCQNPQVLSGLTWQSIKWAFSNLEAGFWHPLTWLSLLLDCQLYGLRAWGYHLTNLLLHAGSTALLFLALRRMTGATGRSALVAALFGLHPLHVESVAWVAERKDVLSTFFWMLAMWMYARYVEQSGAQNPRSKFEARESTNPVRRPESAIPNSVWLVTRHPLLCYALAWLCFVCGLMSKAMVVTLPLMLLLLDWWPLRRFQLRTHGPKLKMIFPLVLEKLPFFVAAFICGVVTLHAEKGIGALGNAADYPLASRIHNALLSYLRYLGKTLWPTDLAVFYPFPTSFPVCPAIGAAVVLLLISALVLAASRKRPYLAAGWIWYTVTLLPVIGVIQVGDFAQADRFTYVPLIGIFMLLTWGACEAARGLRYRVAILSALTASAIAGCAVLTVQQLKYWKDGETLFRHSLAVTADNDLARNNLGSALLSRGNLDEALQHWQQAVKLAPRNLEPRLNLGSGLGKQGRTDEALTQYEEAVRLAPNSPLAHCGLGDALAAKGRLEEACSQYREAVRIAPGDATPHHNLGVALNMMDRTGEAISQFQEALRLRPNFPEARRHLGLAWGKQGRVDEAIAELQEAIRLSPTDSEAHGGLGDALVTKGRLNEAIAEYQQAIRLAPGDATAHHNLGVALGIAGRAEEAIGQFTEAIKLKSDYAEARCNLGIALLKQERSDEAVAQLEEALKLNPKLAEAHHQLGVALGRKGRLDEAISHLGASLKLNPDSAEAHCNLGVALAKQGRLDEAIEHFKKSLSLQPDYPDAQNYLRNALQLKGSAQNPAPT